MTEQSRGRPASAVSLSIRHAVVVTCDGPEGSGTRARLGVVEDGAVVAAEGVVTYVGPAAGAPSPAVDERVIDGRGAVVYPGLVDPHTHLVFAGSRVDELGRKLAGEDYRAIAAGGGGIAATVRATRAASDEALRASARARARALRATGATTVEVKSGYGLTVEDELRLLRVARALDEERVVRTSPTLLGAHAVPPERRQDRARYVAEIVEEMIPRAARERLCDAVDVYCDEGAFDLAETRAILEAARARGLGVKAHVGQFRDLGGAGLLAELGALSADHLEEASEEDLRALARAGTVAVLLPGAWRTLRQRPPDAARLRACGVTVAVGTDCNPGTSPMLDLPLAAALAARDAGLTLEEAVLAVTANAGRAIGRPETGRIAVGAPADLAVFDGDDARLLAYALGGLRPRLVVLGGYVVESGAGDGRGGAGGPSPGVPGSPPAHAGTALW
jgi:imidazolonepropionase